MHAGSLERGSRVSLTYDGSTRDIDSDIHVARNSTVAECTASSGCYPFAGAIGAAPGPRRSRPWSRGTRTPPPRGYSPSAAHAATSRC